MKEVKSFLIIDTKTKRPLYGVNQNTLVFDSEETAYQLARQLFEEKENYLVIEIPDFRTRFAK